MHHTNVDRLVDATLIDRTELTDKDIELINTLALEEVSVIINAGQKFRQHEQGGGTHIAVIF